jgi:hypothetical protein
MPRTELSQRFDDRGRRIDRRRSRFAPRVEGLEGRALLSTLTVMTDADSGPGSLRDTVSNANTGDVINFSATLLGDTITLTSGEIHVGKSLTIQGPGPGSLSISGNNSSAIFGISGANRLSGNYCL